MTADEARRAGYKPTPELRWRDRSMGKHYARVLEQAWELGDSYYSRREWIEVPSWPPQLTDVNAKRAAS